MARNAKTGRQFNKKKGSVLQVSDRKLNKLVKRNKLKKSIGKKSLHKVLKERVTGTRYAPEAIPIVQENDIPLHEADYEYFSKPGRNYDFLTDIPEIDEISQSNKKRKKENENCNLENHHRKRIKMDQNVVSSGVARLSKTGEIVFTKVTKPTENNDMELEEEPEIAPETIEEEAPFEENTAFQEFMNKKILSRDARGTIAAYSASLIESGVEHIEKLPKLLSYLDEANPLPIRRYAMTKLLKVFKDIIPDYKIRSLTDAEKQQQMKKDTKQLLAHEETLLSQYKKYIDVLDQFSKGQIGVETGDMVMEQLLDYKKILKRKSVECLGDLLVSHPHFNFRTIIVGIVVRSMFNHDRRTSDLACNAIKFIFAQNKDFEVILEITRLIGRTIKVRHSQAKLKVLDTFLSLRIKEIEKDEDAVMSAAEMRKTNFALSRKDRRKNKQMRFLEKELEQAGVEVNRKAMSKLRTETVSVVFLTYFRILKMSTRSPLLPSVLEGLAKFAHLINVSYFDDLFNALTSLVESQTLTNRECLHCILTALTLLNGQGCALNIDPFRFSKHLYKTLLSYDFCNLESDIPPALKCLDLMMNKRKKHVSDQRCMAFIKRISISLLKLQPSAAIPMMATMRNIFRFHPKCDILLDTESIGSGMYLPDNDNPDHCNAQSSSLYELCLLKSSFDPTISLYANHILNGLPEEGVNKLPMNLSRILTTELFTGNDSATERDVGKNPTTKTMMGPGGKGCLYQNN